MINAKEAAILSKYNSENLDLRKQQIEDEIKQEMDFGRYSASYNFGEYKEELRKFLIDAGYQVNFSEQFDKVGHISWDHMK